jgi:heparin/heparan-sulfate lyase
VPAALVVFDRIRSAQEKFAKRWVLHSVGEPSIDAATRTVTIRRTDNGYNGQLVNRTLLPAQVTYTKYGKPGEEYLVPNTNGTAMVNYPVVPADSARSSEEAGPWRIEVSPSVPRQADVLLNVMQVMDADGGVEPLATPSSESAQFAGAMIGDRVVLFGKGEAPVGDGAGYALPADARGLDVLVTDLRPGTWQVWNNGRAEAGRHEAKAGDGTIYLRGQRGGDYVLKWTGK